MLLLTGALVGSYFVFPGFKERIDGAYALLSSGNTQALQAWVAWLGADFSRLRTFLLVATLVGLAALGGFIFFDQSRLCRKTNPGERDSA
ncbi:hypothetical protein [Meiothermus sp.]|uniref:hypothetical protein n=1 Tax=Meiothermus sp. TaxID=1955249 RepID=UPI002607C7CC|nr:hypothetical protein [Meiothermus sp.]